MKIFKDKKSASHETESVQPVERKQHNERPRICCIDLADDITRALEDAEFNIYNGTLGSKIKVPNTGKNSTHQVLLNFDFPQNVHEYDLIIIDLDNFKSIEYNPQDHNRVAHTGNSSISLISSFPETLFDPRPFGSMILGRQINEITNRDFLVVAFSCAAYAVDYQPIEITGGYAERQSIQQHRIYSFWDYVPLSTSKYGKELQVSNLPQDFKFLLEKYKVGSVYNQTFHLPTIWTDKGAIEDEKYSTLFENLNSDIVSYMEANDNRNLILLPQINDKRNFLLEFLSKVSPSLYPALFPNSTTFSWKKDSDYWLPNHSNLIAEKIKLEDEFQKKDAEISKRIIENSHKFSFLHDIICETGENLTHAVINFLKWLEFESVEKHDEKNKSTKVFEEDIQVKLGNGLLVVECKGIGGTSTDSDCSQISKIKHRRSKERGKFDVYALYIVNHQRYLPPLKRTNPPFTDHQIQDALNDERGLLTTWQLFNLYFDIEKGILTKEDARKLILGFGLVDFRPQNLTYIDEPKEIFNEGRVCIVNVKNIALHKNEEVLIEKNGKFEKALIIDIQQSNKPIDFASDGELGLKLNIKISKKSILWKTNKQQNAAS